MEQLSIKGRISSRAISFLLATPNVCRSDSFKPVLVFKRIMLRVVFMFIFIFFCACVSDAQEKRALLIGIGNYPIEGGWNVIHGSNDVVLIHKTLVSQGFQEQNIKQLLDAEATYDNIVSSFQELLSVTNKNDVIYIQFSGHGQRITDIDGDEEDRFDESWIPYDAPKRYSKGIYEGEKHITDDFLNEYLTKLRFRVGYGGKIIVIADACHSGSGSRGLGDDENVYKRGSSETFVIPREPANVIRKEKPVDWLFVAACKSYQSNYEYRDDQGNYYGPLSFSIAKSESQLNDIKYSDAIDIWGDIMREITIYPQDINDEGRPSKKNNNLF